MVEILETSQHYYWVDRKNIAFIKFIFESYEGVANITTIDKKNGIVMLRIAPGCELTVHGIISDLNRQFPLKSLEAQDILDKI